MRRREFLKTAAIAALEVASRSGWSKAAAAPYEDAAPNEATRKQPFILGADVSWLLEDEAQGATYWDRGIQNDLLVILKSYGFNYIRGRIFVNPHAPGGYAARRDEAFCDLEHTRKYAQRIAAAGMGFLLSFHYGDTWTSPAKQTKPAAWAHLRYDQLVSTVHQWTADVLKGLKENGTPPQMVSIGNETTDGVLFPEGRVAHFDQFAELINAGCTAVRDFDRSIPVALHNHLGRDNARIRWWVDNFLQRKTEFDIIGMSCYNEAQPGNWEENFNDLAGRYPQLSFMALEYSYSKRYLNDLIFNAPHGKGLGSFIWEPTRWREAIFDHNGINAGADMNQRRHLPASTLPPLIAVDQPIYRPARPPADAMDLPASRPDQPGNANGNPPTTQPTSPAAMPGATTRPGASHGGRYDTNSYILAYPAMAKAYGLR